MFSLRVDNDLELVLPSEENIDEAFALVIANYDHLHEWLPWVNQEYSRESVGWFYRRVIEKFGKNEDEIGLNIVFKGEIVGGAGFHQISWVDRSAEIGYWIAASAGGAGLVTKSVIRLLEYGFEERNLNRIVIKSVLENSKSRAIPEKLGFRVEGVEREGGWLHTRFVDHVVYSLLASEWRNRSKEGK